MNDTPPAPGEGPLCLRLHGPLGADEVANAREWLQHALATHPDTPIVLELGRLTAVDDLLVQLLVDTARALDDAGRVLRIEGGPAEE